MPEAARLIGESVFSPEILQTMTTVFDEVWAEVAHEFKGQRAQDVALARTALAKGIVHFAGLGRTDKDVLKSMALRVLQKPSHAFGNGSLAIH